MAGEAQSDSFLLGSATVMIGAQADLMNLNTEHSIGMVKNVMVKTTPGFTDLTQGVKNSLVYSVMTSNKATVEGEVYEMTSKNAAYALGLDGSEFAPVTTTSTVATALAAPTAPALTSAVLELAAGGGTGFSAGDTIMIHANTNDQIMIRKVVSKLTDDLTLDSGLPVGVPIGAVVEKVNVLTIGSVSTQPYLSAKIVGKLANGDDVVILIPKVKFTAGLNLSFKTDNFDHIPLQLEMYDLVSTDPNYATFQTIGPGGTPGKAMLLTNQ